MAFGLETFSSAGGAVGDLFAAGAMRTRAQGQRLEAEQYDLAAGLAEQNKQFSITSTAIKQTQEQRSIQSTIGGQKADIASAGFEESGSALDLLRDSASQGALTKAVLSQQGLIEEATYDEQAKAYSLMAQASRLSADASDHTAVGLMWSGGIKAATSFASLFTK